MIFLQPSPTCFLISNHNTTIPLCYALSGTAVTSLASRRSLKSSKEDTTLNPPIVEPSTRRCTAQIYKKHLSNELAHRTQSHGKTVCLHSGHGRILPCSCSYLYPLSIIQYSIVPNHLKLTDLTQVTPHVRIRHRPCSLAVRRTL
jgi:hypothetical protein